MDRRFRNGRPESAEEREVAASLMKLFALPDTMDELVSSVGAVHDELAGLKAELARYQAGNATHATALAQLMGKFENVVDRMRDDSVRAAIDAGTLTSNHHYEHMDIATRCYWRVVRHDLRALVRQLCPQHMLPEGIGIEEWRAVAARDVVRLLYTIESPDLAPSLERIVAMLTEAGYRIETSATIERLTDMAEQAMELKEFNAAAQLPVHLDFDVDIAGLSPDDFQRWNSGPADVTKPLLLIAPAYVVGGSQRQQMRPPTVFLQPGAPE